MPFPIVPAPITPTVLIIAKAKPHHETHENRTPKQHETHEKENAILFRVFRVFRAECSLVFFRAN